MIRKPTANEFAYGAMICGALLIGSLAGGHEVFRAWIGATSGWAAAIAAATAIVFMHQSNKIQERAINENTLLKLGEEIDLAHMVAQDLETCAEQIKAVSKRQGLLGHYPPKSKLWKIAPSKKNIAEVTNQRVYRAIDEAWKEAEKVTKRPIFTNTSAQSAAEKKEIDAVDALELMRVHSELTSAASKIYTKVLFPRVDKLMKIANSK